MLPRNLKFDNMEEWFAALPDINRSEICLLNDDQGRGMDVFEANEQFKAEWAANYYRPISTLEQFSRISRSGWYPMLAAIAMYHEDNGAWWYNEPRNPNSKTRREQVEQRLLEDYGRKVVIARVDKHWNHEPYSVFDASCYPIGGKLYIEYEEGWRLREHGSKFSVCLGHEPDAMWMLRATQYLQTSGNMGIPTRGPKLISFNTAAILDWMFIKVDGYLGGNLPVLSSVSAFLDNHQNKMTFKDLKWAVRRAQLCSNIWYYAKT